MQWLQHNCIRPRPSLYSKENSSLTILSHSFLHKPKEGPEFDYECG